jgi:7,8-dihydropterin-6-yl-methyl-4-(beta-D-ribofuranosyl)aminobenzene 5'-phosphate synthase
MCLACHGFSALVTGRRGSEERSVLFDVGPSAEVWLENARRLGVRLASIEAVCLSHWHADHSGGLPGVLAAITRSRLDEGLPPPIVDLHPDRPDQRGTMTPAGTLVLLNPEPTFEAIESAGGRSDSAAVIQGAIVMFHYGLAHLKARKRRAVERNDQ